MSTGNDWDQRGIEKELVDAMDRARQEFFEAIHELEKIICEVPSGLPAADGVQRIRNFAKMRDSAYLTYKLALKRFRDHVGDSNTSAGPAGE